MLQARRDSEDPRREGETPDPALDDADRPDGPPIVCVACAHRITAESARIEIAGQHRHVCVNPSGIPFDIACFDRAPGCVPHGAREAYWSWFEGYAWQIELCGGCRAHLGWSFHGDGSFYGLIATKIVAEG